MGGVRHRANLTSVRNEGAAHNGLQQAIARCTEHIANVTVSAACEEAGRRSRLFRFRFGLARQDAV